MELKKEEFLRSRQIMLQIWNVNIAYSVKNKGASLFGMVPVVV